MVGMGKCFSIFVAIVLGFSLAGFVSAQNDDGPMSNLQFVVVRDYNGKPVRNAAVVLHPVTKKGNQARGGLELKTDNDGRLTLTGFRMVLCEFRCWHPASRHLVKTTASTKRKCKSQ